MLSTTGKYTLALEINLFRGVQVTQWRLLMAAIAMVSIPCFLPYSPAAALFHPEYRLCQCQAAGI